MNFIKIVTLIVMCYAMKIIDHMKDNEKILKLFAGLTLSAFLIILLLNAFGLHIRWIWALFPAGLMIALSVAAVVSYLIINLLAVFMDKVYYIYDKIYKKIRDLVN